MFTVAIHLKWLMLSLRSMISVHIQHTAMTERKKKLSWNLIESNKFRFKSMEIGYIFEMELMHLLELWTGKSVHAWLSPSIKWTSINIIMQKCLLDHFFCNTNRTLEMFYYKTQNVIFKIFYSKWFVH